MSLNRRTTGIIVKRKQLVWFSTGYPILILFLMKGPPSIQLL